MPFNKRKPLKTNTPLQLLGGLSAEQFLNEYWQKKPLLVRQAFTDFEPPISPDELAGLSLEEEVESRIIMEQHQGAPWVLERGPFEPERFSQLDQQNWTLLIQQLDAWSPEVHSIKQAFNFIPDWRTDDIMASYAPAGGSVGPHFDHYDVFLIQAHGERHWKLGQWCDELSKTRDDTPLCILDSFETSEDWVLQPGDLLYVPPKLAHFGVAVNDCITLSVGFRAPRSIELLSSLTDFASDSIDTCDNAFFVDPDRQLQTYSAEIQQDDIARIQRQVQSLISDPALFSNWIGSFLSEPKNPDILIASETCIQPDDLENILSNAESIYKNEGSRFLFLSQSDSVKLFVDGENFSLSEKHLTFVQSLCSKDVFNAHSLLTYCNTLETRQVIAILLENGSLQLDTDNH